MSLIESIKRHLAPEIICSESITTEQQADFLRRNMVIGGKVRISRPDQLTEINRVFNIGGEISIGNNSVEISRSWQFGSRIDIG